MISYRPFWKTLNSSGETTYTLIKNHRVSSSTIDKLRNNKPLNTTTIIVLCRILGGQIEDVLEYIPCDRDQFL